MHSLEVLPFINGSEKIKILDIRTKDAFLKGHIPNAIHLPFPIQLRKIRKQFGSGRTIGDLSSFVTDYEQWKAMTKPYLTDNLWENHKAQLYFLDQGYEGYCTLERHFFKKLQLPELRVLSGWTGSGKTALLETLKEKGAQVINLSELANHRGSVFGKKEKFKQPSSTQFQHQLFELCRSFDTSKTIYTEAEGPFIGSIHLPKAIYGLLQSATVVHLEIPKMARVQYLMDQYRDLDKDIVLEGLQKIQSRWSPENYEQAMIYVKKEDWKELVALLISYYDHSTLYRNYEVRSSVTLHFPKVDIAAISSELERQLSGFHC